MSRSLPPLNWFRTFECSARHLSFTAAAAELNLTQSAVSQQIRLLETRLGTILFNRKTRGLALTDSGRRLLPYVSGAVGNLEDGIAIFDSNKAGGVLKIACSISFSLLWLVPRLSLFLKDHPGLDLRIINTLWPDDYLSSQADVEIRFGSKDLVGDGATLLIADSIIPVCYPAMAKNLKTWSQVCQVPLIQTVGSSDTWQVWADDLDLTPPPPILRSVDSSALALEFVRHENCIALVQRVLAKRLIQANELAIPLALSTTARDNHYIKIRDTHGKGNLPKAFKDWLLSEIQ